MPVKTFKMFLHFLSEAFIFDLTLRALCMSVDGQGEHEEESTEVKRQRDTTLPLVENPPGGKGKDHKHWYRVPDKEQKVEPEEHVRELNQVGRVGDDMVDYRDGCSEARDQGEAPEPFLGKTNRHRFERPVSTTRLKARILLAGQVTEGLRVGCIRLLDFIS